MRASILAVAALLLAGCRGQSEPTPATRVEPATPAAPATSAASEAGPVGTAMPPREVANLATPPVTPRGRAPGIVRAESPTESVTEVPAQGRLLDFEGDAEGTSPAGLSFALTGQGRPGKWAVRAGAGAPSGKKVLVQEDADATDYRFPVAVADAPAARDVRVSAKVRMVSGEVDRAAGLVFRYRDADNYYVTRANSLENNVMLFYVKDGRRIAIGVWNGKVTAGEWHDYAVEARGDAIVVRWDGVPVLDTRDSTLGGAGKGGLWTKADSVTQFDDLMVETLGE